MVPAVHCALLLEGVNHAVVRDVWRTFHALRSDTHNECAEHHDGCGDTHCGLEC